MPKFRVVQDEQDRVGRPPPSPSDVVTGGAEAQKFRVVQKQLSDMNRQERAAVREGSFEMQAGPLARTETGAVAEFDKPGTRFDLARSQTFEGRVEKLKVGYPQYDITVLDDPFGGQNVALRGPNDDAAVILDNDDLKTLSDVADVAGFMVNLETLGTIAGGIAGAGRKLIGRAAYQFGGGLAGRSADLAVENARGYEKIALNEMAAESVLSGGLAAAGEILFAPMRFLVNGVKKGQGAVQLSETELKANKALRDAGVKEGLPLGSLHPLAGVAERQAQRTSKPVETQRLRESEAVIEGMKRRYEALSDVNLREMRDVDLATVVDAAERDVLAMLGDFPAPNPAAGRRALQLATAHLDDVTKVSRDKKYLAAAKHSEGVEFEISKAQEVAEEISGGVRGKLRPDIIDARVAAREAILERPLTDAERDALSGTQVSFDPNGALAEKLTIILSLDSRVAMFQDISAFDQIKALRSSLYDLKTPQPGALPTQENRLAAQLWSALTDAMDNPIGGSPRFKELYKAASISHHKRDTLMTAAHTRMIAQTGIYDNAQILDEVTQPGNARFMRMMQRIAPEHWSTVQESFKNDLASQPEKIIARLDSYRRDPRALSALLTPDEHVVFRGMGRTHEAWQSSAARKARDTVEAGQGRHLFVVEKGTPTDVGRILANSGGKQSAQGEALRGALFQHIVDASGRTEKKGFSQVNFKRLSTTIDALEKRGMLAATLLPEEIEFLRNQRLVASFMEDMQDVGAALQAGEIGAGLIGAAGMPIEAVTTGGTSRLRGFISAFTQGASNAIVGRLMLSSKFRNFMTGTKGRTSDLTTARVMTAIMMETAADMERSAKDFVEVGVPDFVLGPRGREQVDAQ